MLRNKIEKELGLTRKAINYYEEKGLIHPLKDDNGYRNYSPDDLKRLRLIAVYRRLDLSIDEIRGLLTGDLTSLQQIIQNRRQKILYDTKKLELLERLEGGEGIELVGSSLEIAERKESVYLRLTRAFPGYLGRMLFAAYKPFLNDAISDEGEGAFEELIEFLDCLPEFTLSKEEAEYAEEMMLPFDDEALDEINSNKIKAIEDAEQWFDENSFAIECYEEYKRSDEYRTSTAKAITDKLRDYMESNRYYEIAIPLIRKFSRSYDEYYNKMLEANERYMKLKNR